MKIFLGEYKKTVWVTILDGVKDIGNINDQPYNNGYQCSNKDGTCGNVFDLAYFGMVIRMNKVGNFFSSRVKTFAAHNQANRQQLHDPFGCGDIKIKSGNGDKNGENEL